jgi:EAL domain-containing protein (putative c-di-GMP-specific phosphodiesterase class I)
LGGDEFAIILSELGDIYYDTGIVAERIISALNKPFTLNNQNTVVSVSMGIACYPESGRQASILEKNANIALNSAKMVGRGNYQYFTPALDIQHSQMLDLENELHFALEKQEFSVVYQPRFDLQSGKMTGMEALLRWRNSKRGDISPADFIPIAEEAGMIPMIGEWVLRTACQQFSKWLKQNPGWECVLAVNVSPRQLQEKNFMEQVLQVLEETHIPPNQLELEITESMAMRYLKKIEDVLVALRSYGIQLSIDDFGTGYSSLTRLKELPIQSLKIDKSFVQDIDVRVHDNLIIKSTISLAKDLGLNVVAEGVETQSQLQFLVKNQCPEAQGSYYSKPLTIEQMTTFIETQAKEEKV